MHVQIQRRVTTVLSWIVMTLLVGVLTAGGFTPARAQAADENQAVQASGAQGKKYTIATDTTFAPFEFRDPATGDLTGIDMDILKAIAKDQGFEVEIQSVGFQAAVTAVDTGQADGVIAGMGITDERKKKFDFSEPYFDSGIQMAIAESDDEIKGYEDLKGKTVVAKTGTEGESVAKKLAKDYDFKIKGLDQSATMYESVKNGTAVAVFDDYPVLAYGVEQGNGLKIVTDKVPGSQYGFAVKKDKNTELLNAFNAGLKNLRESGEYDEIVNSYLGGESKDEAGPGNIFSLAKQTWPALAKGLWNTLIITIVSFAIALVLGLIFGFMKVSQNKILTGIASVFVAIFRGTPLLVWAFFFYFGLPQLMGTKGDVFLAGVATLSLNAGAYLTEIVRGGIQAVDVGQMEAARSLGLPWGKSMRKVVVPQAVKIATPSIINQLVITLKDSSLLLTIGFAELLYQAQQVYASNFRTTEMLIIVGVIYFIIITVLTWIANIVDRRLNK